MCCCCPPAITALFCLWFQSGFSKGTVAGALTFFPPEPPLYKFERVDDEGKLLEEDETEEKKEEEKTNDQIKDGNYRPKEGETHEEMKSPAQQMTEKAKELRKRAKLRKAQDIFMQSNGLDNISEYTMKKFREIMLSGRQ